MILSNTQVNMFLRCAKQWEYRYVHGIKQPPSGALIQGSAYHGAIEINFKQKIKSTVDLCESDILDAYDTCWRKKIISDDGGSNDAGVSDINWEGYQPEMLKDQGAKVLRAYQKKVAPLIIPVKVEEKYVMDLNNGDKFVGVVDLETAEFLIDHKLKGRMMSIDEANHETQPFSYGLLTGKRDFEFHVGVKKISPEIGIVPVTKTDREIIWWTGVVEEVAKAMKSGIYPPNPLGVLCSKKFCGYWNLCRKE